MCVRVQELGSERAVARSCKSALCLSALIHAALREYITTKKLHTLRNDGLVCSYIHFRAWWRYLVAAGYQISFYLVDKNAHMSQGFTGALSAEKRMDRDEKCAGISYLWVSLGNEACLRQKHADDGLFLIQRRDFEGKIKRCGWITE